MAKSANGTEPTGTLAISANRSYQADPFVKPAASMAAFALLGLSGMPFFQLHQPAMDERDREIDRKSMVAAMCLFWTLLVISVVGMGLALGWDSLVQVPVWAFSGIVWGGWIVIMTARSAASIRMYRAG
jgi:hypothetical protein